MRALIVDDSKFIRMQLRQTLEQFGMTCVEVEHGAQAIDLLRRDPHFDLMMSDVNMPVMNGLECVRVVRAEKLAPSTSIVMVTTESDDSFINQALANGADEFLMKPFTTEGLREKLMLIGFELSA